MGEERKAVMPHSIVKILIHGVFGTNDRTSLISTTIENELHLHIKEKLEKTLHCKVRINNGIEDHIHNIRNQTEHHKKISYADEIDLLINKYGLQIING